MKFRLIVATVIIFFAVSCNKQSYDSQELNSGNPSIDNGEWVTITCGQGQTKVVGTDSGDGHINFQWEAGDKISVKVKGQDESSEFLLVSGAGTSSATFRGILPSGALETDHFVVQWPTATPTLDNQAYNTTGIDATKMLAVAEVNGISGLKTGTINLIPQYSVLKLRFKGKHTVTSIVVNNTSDSKTYTLDCGSGVLLSATSTPFYVVVDPSTDQTNGSNMTVDVKNGATVLDTFTPENKLKFVPAYTLNMPIRKVITLIEYYYYKSYGYGTRIKDVVWAPVNLMYNCSNGSSTDFKGGFYFQWGRNAGQPPINKLGSSYFVVEGPYRGSNGDANVFYFYKNTDYTNTEKKLDWIYTGNDSYWDTTGGSREDHIPTTSTLDPCPDGWRVPTNSEFDCLWGGNEHPSMVTKADGYEQGLTGCWFNGKSTASNSGVFLPAVGFNGDEGDFHNEDDYNHTGFKYQGLYWSSSAGVEGQEYAASLFHFGTGDGTGAAGVGINYRVNGCSIRCVQDLGY